MATAWPWCWPRRRCAITGLLLIVTPDSQEAEKLQQQLRFFCAELSDDILCFPDWETLPYDSFSPHQDIISERLLTLQRLPTLRRGILLVPVATLLQRLPPQAFLDQYSLVLNSGDQLDLDSMRLRLEKAGYRCVSQVHGTWRIRDTRFVT